MRKINVDKLKHDVPGIIGATSFYLHEAVLVALIQSGHQSGISIKVEGTFKEDIRLYWSKSPSKKVVKAWKNNANIAHYAAVGLSLLLVSELTDYKSFEVASFGTGVDYWMNKEDIVSEVTSFYKEARLEISGIFKETKSNTVNMRINLKRQQIRKSDNSKTPAWISVIEFSTPKSKIEKQ